MCQTLGAQSVCAGLEPAATFWWRVYCEARRRGLGAAPVALVVVLGDGADWIWHAAARFLHVGGAACVEIVDLYHAWEHLWTVANAVYGSGTEAAAAWVGPLKRRLVEEGVQPVLAALAGWSRPAPTRPRRCGRRRATLRSRRPGWTIRPLSPGSCRLALG